MKKEIKRINLLVRFFRVHLANFLPSCSLCHCGEFFTLRSLRLCGKLLSIVKTLLTRSHQEAAEIIKRGGIVAFPTETVYGLGASIFDELAVAKIFEAKRRPADNPLIAHIAEIGQIAELAVEVTQSAQKFVEAFFPGPLTIVLSKTVKVPLIATAGLDTVGVRMPRFELAHRFLAACETPVVAPSANLSGRPSPTTWEAVAEDLDGRVDCILQSDPAEIGLESTVVDCSYGLPKLLRTGSVSLEQLRVVVPETLGFGIGESDVVRSPGLKHRHYSPMARVEIVDLKSQIPNSELSNFKFQISVSEDVLNAFIGLRGIETGIEIVKTCKSVEEYAHSVFEFFRECDRAGIAVIYCESVRETDIGVALMDRLRRAAAG